MSRPHEQPRPEYADQHSDARAATAPLRRSRCGESSWAPRMTGRRAAAAVSLALAVWLSACRSAPERPAGGDEPARATSELEPRSLSPERTASEAPLGVRAKMSGHYDDALAMRRAITMGDVVTLKAVASRIASNRWLPSLDARWAAPLANVRGAAARASEVTSVEAGAAALAAVGTACAACHQVMGGPPQSMALSPPVGKDQPTMLAHQAAVDELWEGLVTPDTSAWQRAARSLASGPLAGADSPAAQRAASQLQSLARQSIDAPSSEREKLMAQSLSTCADCHRLHGVRAAGNGAAAGAR
jgi:mono/diheme cytochrome c family protein